MYSVYCKAHLIGLLQVQDGFQLLEWKATSTQQPVLKEQPRFACDEGYIRHDNQEDAEVCKSDLYG